MATQAPTTGRWHPRLVEAAIAMNENRLDVAERLLKPHLKDDPFDVAAPPRNTGGIRCPAVGRTVRRRHQPSLRPGLPSRVATRSATASGLLNSSKLCTRR